MAFRTTTHVVFPRWLCDAPTPWLVSSRSRTHHCPLVHLLSCLVKHHSKAIGFAPRPRSNYGVSTMLTVMFMCSCRRCNCVYVKTMECHHSAAATNSVAAKQARSSEWTDGRRTTTQPTPPSRQHSSNHGSFRLITVTHYCDVLPHTVSV